MYIEKKHISAGCFNASAGGPVIFQAFLGTCVGVSLYDRTVRAGGLLHVLLPEPPSENPPEYPEKYASTALPMLINALKKYGVQEKNLEAVVAGGALVGPLSQMDINLDIGGRSTEIVLSILDQNNISVIHSETGGFFTCTLELNMRTGKSTIKPVLKNESPEGFTYAPPSRETILKTIDHLNPIPQSALKILRMIQRDDYPTKDITAEISKDQVLSGLTLKLCNSAFFSGRVKIENLNDAVLILGEETLMKSIITATVNNFFKQTKTVGYSLCRGGIFYHAVGCACTAEAIARRTNRTDPKRAYTAGLLHDIGKVVLDQYIAKICPVFFRGIEHNGETSLHLEQKILGTSHCQTGELLAEKCHFPESLKQVVSFHHTPEKSTEHREIVSIVYLATLIMSRFNTGLVLERVSCTSLETALDTLGLTLSGLPDLIDDIPLSTFNVKQTNSPLEKTHT